MKIFAYLPVIPVILFILLYGNNIPYADEYGAGASIAIHTAQGTLTFNDLLAQQSDHRIIFTNIVTALSALLFRWDLRFEMIVSVVLAVLNLTLLLSLDKHLPHWAGLIFGLVIFSMRQDWTWGIINCWHFVVFFVLLMIVAAQKVPGKRGLLLMILAAACATFSIGVGFAAWLVGIALLFERKSSIWDYLLWGLGAGATALLYFHNYTRLSTLSFDLIPLARFGLANLGTPLLNLSSSFNFASLLGALGILWLLLNLKRSVWLYVACFGLLCVAMITWGRTDLGFTFAPRGRYATVNNLFWIGLFALTIHRIMESRDFRRLRIVVLSGFIGVFLLFATKPTPPLYVEERRACMEVLRYTRDANCETQLVFEPNAVVVEHIQQLDALNLGLFSTTK